MFLLQQFLSYKNELVRIGKILETNSLNEAVGGGMGEL